jgi:hypothetical protein
MARCCDPKYGMGEASFLDIWDNRCMQRGALKGTLDEMIKFSRDVEFVHAGGV